MFGYETEGGDGPMSHLDAWVDGDAMEEKIRGTGLIQ